MPWAAVLLLLVSSSSFGESGHCPSRRKDVIRGIGQAKVLPVAIPVFAKLRTSRKSRTVFCRTSHHYVYTATDSVCSTTVRSKF
eukprot:m.75052 g.75052  ORF g.75052 m.75052 type:complete len:84 (+) comp50375_c0_seq10:40-291(+)